MLPSIFIKPATPDSIPTDFLVRFNKDNKLVFCACGFIYAASISLLFSYVEISNTFLLCCIAIWVATAIAVDVCPVSLPSSVQKDTIAILLSF